MGRVEQSPNPEPLKVSYLESVLNKRAGMLLQIPIPLEWKDELDLYLKEPPKADQGVMEYQRVYELAWPNLTRMAFDFLAIPAMSSECERVFSFCAKEITPLCVVLTAADFLTTGAQEVNHSALMLIVPELIT